MIKIICQSVGLSAFILYSAIVFEVSTFYLNARTQESEVINRHGAGFLVPNNPLTPGQPSIEVAMRVFRISLPSHVNQPVYDPNLDDRGLTIKDRFKSKMTVKIGPSAFQSWGLLASTLAHEIEVHTQQNFLLIHLFDALGWHGTDHAERVAYQYELVNARRFGLQEIEQQHIFATMETFYALPPALSSSSYLGRVVNVFTQPNGDHE